MSAARAYTYPALQIVKRPVQAAMFDMVALDTRPFVQTCLPGCGASPANKRAELPHDVGVLVRLGWHAVDLDTLTPSPQPVERPRLSAWVQLSFKSWRVKPRTHVLTPDNETPVTLHSLHTHAEDMMGLVKRLRMDDMIACGDWRLELIRFGDGTPFYALHYANALAGIADIEVRGDYLTDANSPYAVYGQFDGIEALQWKLCLCMAVVGCTRDAMTFHEGEARTPIEVHKRDLPYLF